MPLFGKPSFKAARKVPKRRADAGSTNPSQLTDKAALDPNLDFSQTPLQLSLGGQSMIFQNGNWVAQDGKSIISITGVKYHYYTELNLIYFRIFSLCWSWRVLMLEVTPSSLLFKLA